MDLLLGLFILIFFEIYLANYKRIIYFHSFSVRYYYKIIIINKVNYIVILKFEYFLSLLIKELN